MKPDTGSFDGLSERFRVLPSMRAPASLLPRVMAAARAAERLPWWKRAWWTWAPAARLAYGAALAVPFALVLRWSAGPGGLSALPAKGLGLLAGSWWGLLVPLAKAAGVALGASKAPLLAAAFASYLCIVAAGAGIHRVAYAARRLS